MLPHQGLVLSAGQMLRYLISQHDQPTAIALALHFLFRAFSTMPRKQHSRYHHITLGIGTSELLVAATRDMRSEQVVTHHRSATCMSATHEPEPAVCNVLRHFTVPTLVQAYHARVTAVTVRAPLRSEFTGLSVCS